MHMPSPQSQPLPPPDPSSHHPAGWYPDPLDPGAWRWWNGAVWTAHHHKPGKKPRLPSFLSWPVVIAAPFALLLSGFLLYDSPRAFAVTVLPAAILLPTFWWLDRIEPEPLGSRIHAVLWGATVAVVVALIVNVPFALLFGEGAAAVIAAPLIEEAGKVAGVLWAVRRRDLDSISDGIIYAGLVASGFALMEDVTYFAVADSEGQLSVVLIMRGVLTPFAHPLFTMWAGLAIGWAVSKRHKIAGAAFGGYLASVTAHALWNGSLVIGLGSETDGGIAAALLIVGLFVLLFIGVAIAVVRGRAAERRTFDAAAPFLVQYFGLTPVEQGWLHSYRAAIAARRTLPSRVRGSFDGLRAAIARLAAVRARGGDPALEQVYTSQIVEARARLSERLADTTKK